MGVQKYTASIRVLKQLNAFSNRQVVLLPDMWRAGGISRFIWVSVLIFNNKKNI